MFLDCIQKDITILPSDSPDEIINKLKLLEKQSAFINLLSNAKFRDQIISRTDFNKIKRKMPEQTEQIIQIAASSFVSIADKASNKKEKMAELRDKLKSAFQSSL